MGTTIPLYKQQSSGDVPTLSAKGIPTEVGVYDRTDSGMVPRAIGKVGAAIGDVATVLELVRQRQEKQKIADTDIALDEIYQTEESKALAFTTAIKSADGAERLKLYEDFQTWNNSYKDPEKNPLNLNNIDKSTASYHAKILKENGYTEEQKAKFNLKMDSLKDKVYAHTFPLITDARENIAIQTTQESIKNSQLAMLGGLQSVGETNAQIVLAYDDKADISPEKKKYLVVQDIQHNTKLFIENEIDKDNPNPQVLKDFNAGKYDGYILAGKDGVNQLDTLRNQVKNVELGIKVDETVNKYISDILVDPFNAKKKVDAEASIKADKKLSPDQQKLAISQIDTEVNKRQQEIRETRTEGHRQAENSFFNLVNNKQTGAALEYLNKVDVNLIDEKEKYAYRKMLIEGNGDFPKSNPGVLANYQYRILKDPVNVSDDEILKDLNLHPKDKIDLIKERTNALTKSEKPELVAALGELKKYADTGVLIGKIGEEIPVEKMGENGAKYLRLQKALRDAVAKGEDADIALERLTKVDKNVTAGNLLDKAIGFYNLAKPAISALTGGVLNSTTTEQGNKGVERRQLPSGKWAVKKGNQWEIEK